MSDKPQLGPPVTATDGLCKLAATGSIVSMLYLADMSSVLKPPSTDLVKGEDLNKTAVGLPLKPGENSRLCQSNRAASCSMTNQYLNVEEESVLQETLVNR